MLRNSLRKLLQIVAVIKTTYKQHSIARQENFFWEEGASAFHLVLLLPIREPKRGPLLCAVVKIYLLVLSCSSVMVYRAQHLVQYFIELFCFHFFSPRSFLWTRATVELIVPKGLIKCLMRERDNQLIIVFFVLLRRPSPLPNSNIP